MDAETIDKLNILRASLHAMHRCVQQLPPDAHGAVLVQRTTHVFDRHCHCVAHYQVDGPYLPPELEPGTPGAPTTAHAVIKGDASCTSIAAASIVAKVLRSQVIDTT